MATPTDASGQDNSNSSPKKLSKLHAAWAWLDVDFSSFLQMAKFAMPPTIGLCIFQSGTIADTFTTIGYLAPVATILASTLAPRAAFIQNIIMDVFAVSVATAVALLAMWSAIQARKHTTSTGESVSDYNSSASAVVGVWLFALTYLINVRRQLLHWSIQLQKLTSFQSFKSAMPQFKFAYVMASIIMIVTLAYAPQMTEMTAALSIARRLFGALLLGLAIATGISLSFFPATSRKLVIGHIAAYLSGIRKVLEAQSAFLISIEDQSMFHSSSESETLRSEVKKLRLVNNKLFSEIKFAKKEIAYGYLDAADLSEMHRLLRAVFLPIAGMTQMTDIFERLAKLHGWCTLPRDERPAPETSSERIIMGEYEGMMQILHTPLKHLSHSIYEAIDHLSIVLKFKKNIAKPVDEERNESSLPGQSGFSDYLARNFDLFDKEREAILNSWVDAAQVTLSPVKTSDSSWPDFSFDNDDLFATHQQRQLFVLVYVSLNRCTLLATHTDSCRFCTYTGHPVKHC
jgi:hypothetical protein